MVWSSSQFCLLLSGDQLASSASWLPARLASHACNSRFSGGTIQSSWIRGLHTHCDRIGSGCCPGGLTGPSLGLLSRLSREEAKCRTGFWATMQEKAVFMWSRVSLSCVLFFISGLSFSFHFSLCLAIHPADSPHFRHRGGCFI